jgi:non-specific serine/threonine protein kinase
VIARFPGGVWFVDLAPLSDAGLVARTVLLRLGIPENPLCTPEEALEQALFPQTILLVLDNCEHLIQACASLTHRLLSTCPGLRVLATSREALSLPGEHLYPVPALSLPPTVETMRERVASQLLEYGSVRLFVERARLSAPAFELTLANAEAVVRICRRLDGIPLAIELAAVRVRSLSAEEINSRLDDRFRLLTGGSRAALPRQQTLRALVDWSYDLLNAQEKSLLARLSAFSGGWTLEAAEAVTVGTTLRSGRYWTY